MVTLKNIFLLRLWLAGAAIPKSQRTAWQLQRFSGTTIYHCNQSWRRSWPDLQWGSLCLVRHQNCARWGVQGNESLLHSKAQRDGHPPEPQFRSKPLAFYLCGRWLIWIRYGDAITSGRWMLFGWSLERSRSFKDCPGILVRMSACVFATGRL